MLSLKDPLYLRSYPEGVKPPFISNECWNGDTTEQKWRETTTKKNWRDVEYGGGWKWQQHKTVAERNNERNTWHFLPENMTIKHIKIAWNECRLSWMTLFANVNNSTEKFTKPLALVRWKIGEKMCKKKPVKFDDWLRLQRKINPPPAPAF